MPSAADVLKILESDFNERGYEGYVSQDDFRFIQHLSDNIKQREDGHYELPLPFKSSTLPLLLNNPLPHSVALRQRKVFLGPMSDTRFFKL